MPSDSAERDHGLDDGQAVVPAGEIADEGAVDLDLVEGEGAEIAQRRIAGAEIVERDADAEPTQFAQRAERHLVVGEEATR